MSQAEITTSLTDLIMAIEVFVLTLLLRRTPGSSIRKQTWIRFFSWLTVSCLLGFVNHGLLPEHSLSRRILWIFLYAALFRTTWMLLPLSAFHCPERISILRSGKPWLLFSIVLYLPATLIYLLTDADTLYWYLIYAAVIAVIAVTRFVLLALRRHRVGQLMAAALFFAALALLVEFFKIGCFHLIWDFDENGTTHFILMISIYFLYLAAKTDAY